MATALEREKGARRPLAENQEDGGAIASLFSSSSPSDSEGSQPGGPYDAGLELFLAKSQLAAYESHRAMFEAYGGGKYNATGVIQWMLNSGLPQHIWHLFDWFLDGGGSYFGSQRALEPLHAQFDAYDGTLRVVNSAYEDSEQRLGLTARLFALNGVEVPLPALATAGSSSLAPALMKSTSFAVSSTSTYFNVGAVPSDGVVELGRLDLAQLRQAAVDHGGVVLLRLDLAVASPSPSSLSSDGAANGAKKINSAVGAAAPKPNTYWLSHKPDAVDWDECNFYMCNISAAADYSGLDALPSVRGQLAAQVAGESAPCEPFGSLSGTSSGDVGAGSGIAGRGRVVDPQGSGSGGPPSSTSWWCTDVTVANAACGAVAFFVHVRLLGEPGVVFWDDNFVTLLANETRTLKAVTAAPLGAHTAAAADAYNSLVAP